MRRLVPAEARRSVSEGEAKEGNLMHYVYILKSIKHPDKIYVGFTSDLKRRLSCHNWGDVPHTRKFLPWKLVCYFAFSNKYLALSFENYLKSGSGRAFLRKRLISTSIDSRTRSAPYYE